MLEQERSDALGRGTGPAILVIDDDADFLHALATILLDEGYHVTTAAHGEAALSYLRGSPRPDLILLNLVMPVMNGWSFMEELHRDPDLNRLPVVLVSGVGDLAQQASSLGAAAYLSKPVEVKHLLATVDRHRR